MGWWSYDILGGDEPLDCISYIEDVSGLTDLYTKEPNKKDAEVLEKCLPALKEKCSYGPIGLQTLAYILMRYGVKFDESTRELFVEACLDDDWDNIEREHIIENFIETIKAYDGTPVKLNSMGLFEVIQEHIEEGKTGLVNKVKGD